jgi:uncharacterized SAM-binding protein YcdF (DUF218 family)
MLFLKKLLPMFVLPLGIAFLLLAFAWWRRRRWPAFVAVALLYVCGTGVVASWLTQALESQYAPVPLAAAGPADAVVVLGGIFGPPVSDGFLPNIGDSIERLEAGIRLVQQGRAPLLVFTAAYIPWDERRIYEGELSRHEALARGVPAERILLTREVEDTADEARAVAELARSRGWKHVILVTSAWHMPRAARQFRAAGAPIVPFPVDYHYDRRKPLTALDFLPSAQALGITEGIMREFYGLLFYEVRDLWSP